MSSILDSASEAAATATRRMSIILSPASMGSDGSGPRQESMVDSDEESEDDDGGGLGLLGDYGSDSD